jgi:predicted HicB family RNase H-like nuclease
MAKMGRPAKKKSEVKEETLTLRLTKAERRAADEAAKRAGVSLSDWARRAVILASGATKL